MSIEVINLLCKFESLVKSGEIDSFSVHIDQGRLLIRSVDGTQEQIIMLDSDTFSSLKVFFHEVGSIQYESFDYTNLKSMIHAKTIIERMLHDNKDSTK